LFGKILVEIRYKELPRPPFIKSVLIVTARMLSRWPILLSATNSARLLHRFSRNKFFPQKR
jgi:hypothetical protein